MDYTKLLGRALEVMEFEITNTQLLSAFHLFDMDGNGSISLEEIQYLLSGVAGTIDNKGKDDMIGEAVAMFCDDIEGEVQFKHFKQIMYSLFLHNN